MLIVDTSNVLHVEGVLPTRLAPLGVPGLIRLLSGSRYADRRITLVCDGGPGRASSGVRMDGVHVLYAGALLEADDVIETLIERYHRGNTLEVVSSDRRLVKAAKRRGGRTIASDRFLGWLVEDEARPGRRRAGHGLRRQVPLDVYSVRAWCREFGVAEPEPERSSDGVAGGSVPKRPKPAKKRKKPDKGPGSVFGESLGVSLPGGGSAEESTDRDGDSGATGSAPATHDGPPAGRAEEAVPPVESFDPVLLEALEEWRDRLRLDDLDMRRWTPDADPL